jgi:hypothetical protein
VIGLERVHGGHFELSHSSVFVGNFTGWQEKKRKRKKKLQTGCTLSHARAPPPLPAIMCKDDMETGEGGEDVQTGC